MSMISQPYKVLPVHFPPLFCYGESPTFLNAQILQSLMSGHRGLSLFANTLKHNSFNFKVYKQHFFLRNFNMKFSVDVLKNSIKMKQENGKHEYLCTLWINYYHNFNYFFDENNENSL